METNERTEGAPGQKEVFIVRESVLGARQRFSYLSELWLLGELDRDRYVKELARVIYLDEEGDCWVISPENGNWYRVTEQGPELGEPPAYLYRPVEDINERGGDESAEAALGRKKSFCVYCGSPLKKDAMFCRKCGKHV